MQLSDPVSSILSQKKKDVWDVHPSNSVYDAVALMAEKQIGALPVMDGDRLIGLVSERDYARKVILMGRNSKDTRVSDIMMSPPVTVSPEDSVTHCMHVMTELRIRHLPVVKGERMLGIVSIGDLVNWTISRHEETIQQLHEYIAGSYPA
jgi:CBS domain-containing protein